MLLPDTNVWLALGFDGHVYHWSFPTMTTISVEQAQARLAQIIANLPPGEGLIVTLNAQPVARLERLAPASAPAVATAIWEEFAAAVAQAPEAELARLPSDAAARHDHYLQAPGSGE